ncbi:MAG: hypothetical protein PHT84_04935, partial [Candidatus Pacebacteria bacterium]|nr:hypothetical protein [Candidatus Paceibacterota bacterium]
LTEKMMLKVYHVQVGYNKLSVAMNSNYWSGTQNAENTNNAWNWNTYNGNINNNDKNNQNSVRCAH